MDLKRMDERILVCISYGPNGERLIRRGSKLANMLNCPLYILTVDPLPKDEMDIEKLHYIEQWEALANANEAIEYIVKYNEKRPIAKVIGEVAKQKQITQIILGQTAQSRWKEITKGSIINALLQETSFVDLHIISVSRELKHQEDFYEKGIRAYLIKDENGLRMSFVHTPEDVFEGIFYKEVGTDFNNGIFKCLKDTRMIEVHVHEDYVKDPSELLS